jgi:hypothetical protein
MLSHADAFYIFSISRTVLYRYRYRTGLTYLLQVFYLSDKAISTSSRDRFISLSELCPLFCFVFSLFPLILFSYTHSSSMDIPTFPIIIETLLTIGLLVLPAAREDNGSAHLGEVHQQDGCRHSHG